MRALGILSMVAMALVGAVVGTRLLLLARSSRQLPELAMGLGLVLVTVLGGPLAAVSRLPALVATGPGDLLFGLGVALTSSGIALFYVFTWRVFRVDAGWALGVVVVAALVLAGEWVGILAASGRGTSMEEILPHTRPWGIGIVATVALAFLWTGIESLRYYEVLRRRLALGLADPVVANRFLLWAGSGFATVIVCAAIASSMLAGLAPMRHPLPLACIGLAAVACSVCWYLAFLPPESYVRAIRRRAMSW